MNMQPCQKIKNVIHDIFFHLAKYRWGVGTSPGLDDVIAFRDKSHTVTNTCHNFKTEVLKHNTKYFSTLTAYNGGHARKNITVSSDGGKL